MRRSIRIAFGLLVSIVGLTLIFALGLHAVVKLVTSFFDTIRGRLASAPQPRVTSVRTSAGPHRRSLLLAE